MTNPLHDDTEWSIEFHFPDTNRSVRMPVNGQLVLGRADSSQMVFNGLDLTTLNGENMGVSRKHAVIRWQGPQLFLYDMDSNNGTILNSVRLQPSIGYRLSDGDTIYLGHLQMTIRLNTDLGKTCIRA